MRHLLSYQYNVRQLAPEFRESPSKAMNFRSDIFQLGLIVWCIADHMDLGGWYFCPRNVCTNPNNSCNAEHSNPVELPPCRSDDVPGCINEVINHCRHADPKARKPVRQLLEYFPEKGPPAQLPDLVDIGSICSYVVRDECGSLPTELHFHRNACKLGDFDLCSNCVSRGIHCLVPEHQLMKRIQKNGVIVTAPE